MVLGTDVPAAPPDAVDMNIEMIEGGLDDEALAATARELFPEAMARAIA